jgi:hypothetical protein
MLIPREHKKALNRRLIIQHLYRWEEKDRRVYYEGSLQSTETTITNFTVKHDRSNFNPQKDHGIHW